MNKPYTLWAWTVSEQNKVNGGLYGSPELARQAAIRLFPNHNWVIRQEFKPVTIVTHFSWAMLGVIGGAA